MTHANRTTSPARRPAFTLIEVLIVVGIIVLMLALAVPAFRSITGSRSISGATNVVSAVLARARADAVGLQQTRGMAVYADATGQSYMAEIGPVTFAPYGNNNTGYPAGAYVYAVTGTATRYYVSTAPIVANTNQSLSDPAKWHEFTAPVELVWVAASFSANPILYDRLPDTDSIPLPLGVGIQVIADSGYTPGGAARQADGYLRAGTICFDGAGRLAYLRPGFVFSQYGPVGAAAAVRPPNAAGTILTNVAINTSSRPPLPAGATAPIPLTSSFGLVLYDREAYAARNFPAIDPTFSGVGYTANTPSESDAEAWLDANASPLLLNRFNGTLVRGEQP